MKQKIHVNLIPLYKTNKVDAYTKYDYTDESVADLVICDQLLEQLSKKYILNGISINGGEISLLSDLYFDLLYKIVNLYSNNVKVYTNFIQFSKALISGTDIISLTYNFTDEPSVFKNIKAAIQVGKIINIQTVDKACNKETPESIIAILNGLNIKSWEITPEDCFKDTLLKFLKHSSSMNFAFHNKLQLDGLVDVDSYDIQNVYITPHNKYALKENNKLVEFDDIDILAKELNKIKEKQTDYCDECKVKLKCMANYYKVADYTLDSDCSFSDLIYTYSKR